MLIQYFSQPYFEPMKQDWSTKLSLLFITFALLLGVGCSSPGDETGNEPTKLLLISFDGFRYDYLSKAETPNFGSFIEEGVMAESLIPIFPTKTFPNHYSIVTGLYPENSGLIGNTMYDPKWDKWYRISNREAVENGEWYQGEPIWSTVEKQGLVAGTMFWVGSEADIQGMRPTYWKTYDGSMSDRARIDTVVSWFTRKQTPIDFGTLYFELVDSQGHDYGTRSDSLIAAVEKSDRLLGYLAERLKQEHFYEQMNIMIVSDHGMVDLSAEKTIVLDSLIDLDDVKRYTLDPVTMLQPNQGKVEKVYEQLKQSENHYTVYKKENLPERYHLKNHRRVMDIIVVADMPYTILTSEHEDDFIKSLPQGTHGYDYNQKEMHGIFAARGPAFVSGDTTSSFQNVHIYELMSHLLGLKPAPNDGTLDSVKVLLKQ